MIPDPGFQHLLPAFFIAQEKDVKEARGLMGALCCPQIVMMRGEWSENFLTEAIVSILPPLSFKVWETMNLSILDTAKVAPAFPLS